MPQPIPIIWDFEKNKFIKMAGTGGGSGIIAEDIGNTVIDNEASNGNAIYKSVNGASTSIIINADIPTQDYGMVGVNIRMKTSNNTFNSNAILIKTYFKSSIEDTNKILLSTTYLKGTDFVVANKYQNIGFVCNYNNNIETDPSERIFRVEILSLSGYSADIKFDYCKVQLVFPGVYAIPTVQS